MRRLDSPIEQANTASSEEALTLTADEIASIEAAEADVATRGSIPLEEAFAWLASLDSDTPLPEPQPRHIA